MYGYNDNNSNGKLILEIIASMLLIVFFSCSFKSCSRSSNDMIYIENGYCYDYETKIIHKEQQSGRYTYTYIPHISENGNYYKYDESTGNWIELDR